MKRMSWSVGLIVVVALVAGVVSPAMAKDDKAAIEALGKKFEELANKKDAAGIGQMYAEEAKMLGSNMPIQEGRAAIQNAWAEFFKTGFSDLKLTVKSVEKHGNLLIEFGEYTSKFQGVADKGKYVVIWKKVGGEWKLWVDSFSTDLPAKS